ncbi:probable carboxylesterase 18 [Cajanus cajan]|uniref:Gibberellin receptor GID1L3 n=1 Tax=Cajanus cajan TaxID=3821 RepID=A0A151RI84_CAJCA|nr:probable carboxylesterase 18 [Cajanus cajan]KYP42267.1 putative gibberellin receptor GID1L3 [Cajanus cajan]
METATLPWKHRLLIALLSTLADASRRSDATINRRLFSLTDRKAPAIPTSVHALSSSDVTVHAARNLWFRLFIPSSSAASLPVIVYFHGGAFAFFAADSAPYDAVCRLLCRSLNAVVVSVNYRLAPEHRYPAQYDDGVDVLKFLDQNGAVLPRSADVSKCFLAGDSAGANLAHHVAVRVSKEGLRTVNVIGLVSVQPFFGGEERTQSEIELTRVPIISVDRCDWHWKAFLPNGLGRDHESVNVSGPNAVDISGLDYPNTIVFMGGLDPLRDWQRKYYEWLRKSGKMAELIDYPNAIHAFYLFPDLPETSFFVSQVKEFMIKQMSNVN